MALFNGSIIFCNQQNNRKPSVTVMGVWVWVCFCCCSNSLNKYTALGINGLKPWNKESA